MPSMQPLAALGGPKPACARDFLSTERPISSAAGLACMQPAKPDAQAPRGGTVHISSAERRVLALPQAGPKRRYKAAHQRYESPAAIKPQFALSACWRAFVRPPWARYVHTKAVGPPSTARRCGAPWGGRFVWRQNSASSASMRRCARRQLAARRRAQVCHILHFSSQFATLKSDEACTQQLQLL